jgi:DNA-binding XRE family transcriptional regulator
MRVGFQALKSSHSHSHVAFPLPFIPLSFRWKRPLPWPATPNSLGEHLRKRRGEAGLTQNEVAASLGVNTWTFLLWEKDQHIPAIRFYPAIFGFLGYDPYPAPTTLGGELRSARRRLGLPISEAAKRAGVDEATFTRLEDDQVGAPGSIGRVQAFVALFRT